LTCSVFLVKDELVGAVQDMIQNMFRFLPNGEPVSGLQAMAESDAQDPLYDTPQRAPRPTVAADRQPAAVSSPVQPPGRPILIARACSSKIMYVYILSLGLCRVLKLLEQLDLKKAPALFLSSSCSDF